MPYPSVRTGLALVLALSLSPVFAEEGVDRAVSGAKDTVTSPGKVVEGIEEDTREHGAVGVVTGSIKGGAKAAGQAVKGAADVGVGVIETITEPLRD
ncbi:MAG: hypothetical protein RLW61_06560 [Gammaproteobacteria bacterium]